MRFGSMFTRVVDSGNSANTTLGNDAANFDPTKSHTDIISGFPALKDCLYESRLTNINGFPVQRLVVGYMPPVLTGAPPDLQATMWLQDTLSGFWFMVQAAPVSDPDTSAVVVLPVASLAYFDTPAMPDTPNTNRGTGSAGSVRVFLLVSVPGGSTAADGVHTFVIGTDVSNPGL